MSPIPVTKFADRLTEIMPVIMKGFFKRQSCEIYRSKITLPQFFVLDFIIKNEQPQMKDLAQFMNVTMATMTGIVQRLVRRNFAQRVYDDEDRRIVKVKMTKEGMAAMNRIYQRRREVIINIFGQIPARDRDEYLRILGKIKEVLVSEPETEKK